MYDPNLPTSFDYRDGEQPARPQSDALLPCPFCGARMIRSGLDQPHFQQWWEHEDRATSKCVLKNQTISDASKVYKIAWNTRRIEPSDSARRAADEIADYFEQSVNHKAVRTLIESELAAIISKHFAAAPADNDAESSGVRFCWVCRSNHRLIASECRAMDGIA